MTFLKEATKDKFEGSINGHVKLLFNLLRRIAMELLDPVYLLIKGRVQPFILLSNLIRTIKPLDDELLFIPPYAGHFGDIVNLLCLAKPLKLEQSLNMSIIVFNDKQFELASLFRADLKRIISFNAGSKNYDFYQIYGLIYLITMRSVRSGKINFINHIIPLSLSCIIGDTTYTFFKRKLKIKNAEDTFSIPEIKLETRNSIYTKLIKMGFEKSRLIIINPYSNVIKGELKDFWDKLVKELKSLKFEVVTNLVGEQKPIAGTIGLHSTWGEIIPIAEFSGTVIAIRSGISDLLQFAHCRLVNIYPAKYLGGFSMEQSYINYSSLFTNNTSHLDLILKGGEYETAINNIIHFIRDRQLTYIN